MFTEIIHEGGFAQAMGAAENLPQVFSASSTVLEQGPITS